MGLLLLFAGGGGGAPPVQEISVKSIDTEEAVGKPTITGGAFTQALTPKSIASEEAVGKPNVFVYVAITPKSIPSAEHVGAPRFTLPAAPAPPSQIVVRVMDRDTPLAERAVLEERAAGAAWQEVLNSPGTGRVVVQNDDPDLAAVRYGDLLRFELGGLARFLAIAERKKRVEISRDEEVGELTEISGRGTLARWARAVVYPDTEPGALPFSDQRVFNFASPDLDDSAWAAAINTPQTLLGFTPQSWPDADADYLWDRPVWQDGVPPGDAYLRHWFTVADDVTGELWVDADDEFDAWIDGVFVQSDRFNPTELGVPEHTRLRLTAGDHLLAIRARNLNALKAGVIVTVLELDATGAPVGVITHSTHSAGWKVLGYPPSPPGFTPGAVLRILLADAQARGALTGTTLGFTDTTDSAGVAWPVTADLAFRAGTTLLAVLEQLAEVYLELKPSPSTYRLDAYVTRGEATTVEFVEAESILELVHDGAI